jgi:hypothetical protein
MHIETIRTAVRRQPFVPFFLRMNDGRVFHVSHPDYIAVSRRVVFYVDPATDAEIYLEPVLIASLEPATPPPQPTAGPQTGGNS